MIRRVNAIVTAGNPLGALAAFFPSPEPQAIAGAASPVFLNIIHALLSGTTGAHPIAEGPMTEAATSLTEFSGPGFAPPAVEGSNPLAAPRQLADALIRSMLARTVATNAIPSGSAEAGPIPVGGVAARPVSKVSASRGPVQTGMVQTSLVPAGSAASPVSLGPLPATAQTSSKAPNDQVTLAPPPVVEPAPITPGSEFSKKTVPVVDMNADVIVVARTTADKSPVVADAHPPGPQLPVGVAQKTAKSGSRISAGPISTAHKEDAPTVLARVAAEAITNLPAAPVEATLPNVAASENGPVSATPSRTLPTPVKSIEPHLAPALSRDDPGLAFAARLTPVAPEANSQEPAELPEPPEPAPVAASEVLPMPEPAATPISPFELTATDIQKESISAKPAPPPEAAPQASVTREPQPRAAGTPAAPTSAASSKSPPAPAAPDLPIRIAGTGAASTGDFSRAFVAAAPLAGPAIGAAPGNVFVAARDAARVSDPQAATTPAVETKPMQAASVQDLTLRIARPEAPAVDLHVTQRAGEIQVSVRTPDPALQTSLRQDLNTLTSSLERAGYRTDTVVPRAEMSSQMGMRDERQAQPGTPGRGGSTDSQDGGSGESDGRGGRRQQPQQNPQDQRTRRWLDELESMP